MPCMSCKLYVEATFVEDIQLPSVVGLVDPGYQLPKLYYYVATTTSTIAITSSTVQQSEKPLLGIHL